MKTSSGGSGGRQVIALPDPAAARARARARALVPGDPDDQASRYLVPGTGTGWPPAPRGAAQPGR
jgi:hypothetical protein